MTRLIAALIALGLCACTAPAGLSLQPPARAEPDTGDAETAAWSFSQAAPALRIASCPDGVSFARAPALALSAKPVATGPDTPPDGALIGLRFAGAWHLTADDPNFGGLSGLAVLRSGSLLAVTDAGAFAWIGIEAETATPDGTGALAFMRDASGDWFDRKVDADAEGLALRDGLALVSFEQDHRVEAFDLEGCGAAARAALITRLAPVIRGKRVPDNRGAEALSLDGDGLQVGFEFRTLDGSPAGTLAGNGEVTGLTALHQPGLYLQTGLDVRDGLVARLFRAYDPVRGPRVNLRVTRAGTDDIVASASLKSPLPVDNFEGVALARTPAGGVRIWLISDDNFSPRQRTLLFAFDLDP